MELNKDFWPNVINGNEILFGVLKILGNKRTCVVFFQYLQNIRDDVQSLASIKRKEASQLTWNVQKGWKI